MDLSTKEKLKEDLTNIINKIKDGEIIPCFPSKEVIVEGEGPKNSIGLPCLKCVVEKENYKEFTKNPVVISHKQDGEWFSFYFHENCLR